MSNGVLVLTKAAGPHTELIGRLEALGFKDVTVTDKEKDALNTVICNMYPRLVMIDSWYYQDATAYRIGELVKQFPKLNIAVVSVHDFPASRAPWFIWEGAKSYVSLWEGEDEFKKGLRVVRDGGQYISPKVQELIDSFPEWPDTKDKMTRRQKECLIMLCNGCSTKQIGEALHISRSTVYNHIQSLFGIFHVHCRAEMTTFALKIGLITIQDIRFYDRKKERQPLPEWAAVKRKCDRLYFE
ncbi:response regulator transcription factor [Treponema sp. R6D11]